MTNIKKGWLNALFTAFLWAAYVIFLKTASTYMQNVNGLVVVLQAMVAGSFLLLVFAGPGRLSIETLKSPYTWSFGTLQLLSNLFSFAALTYALSATSLTLLTRFSIILSVLATIFIEKKVRTPSKPGFILVVLGLLVVAISIDSEFRAIALFWIFLVCLVKVVRSRIASYHKESNLATGDFRTELRVTGYILAITSLFYALLLFIVMKLGFNQYIPDIIPTTKEFFALKPLLLSMGAGAVIMAVMRYTELISTKHIGGTNFLTTMAFVPLIAYISQYTLSIFNVIPAPITNDYEIVGGILIIAGALLLTKKAVKKSSNKIKLTAKNKNELNVLRETIMTTKIAFNDDMDLVASKLGIGKRTINSILSTEKEVSKTIKNKIIFGHAENVAGIDHLTGCLNKISFDIKLQQLENIEKALLLFIDLDKFKPVNDTYGHDTGDAILKGIAERLMNQFKQPHVVARLGGDEYCVLVYGADKIEAEKYKKSIESIVKASFIVDGIADEITVGCSTGSAHYPTDTKNGLELKAIADKDMYEHKESKGDFR